MVLRMIEWVPKSLCSIEGEGGGGDGGGGDIAGAGGAAAALAGGGDGGGGDGGQGDGGQGDGGGGGQGDAEWLGQFSAAGGDADNPSHRDWLKAKGFKSLDDVAKSYRETEKALRGSGKLSVPGENSTAEELATFRSAIGVPEAAEKYEVKLPEGADGELDTGFVEPMKKAAFEAGVPAPAFQKLSEEFVKWQLDQANAMKVAEDGDATAWKNAQGAQTDAKMADVNKAMRALDLTPVDIAGMQQGLAQVYGKPGSGRVLDLLAKLGAGMAEDALIGGGGAKRFGITGAEAQAEIDRLIVDKEFQGKLTAKDPDATARWNRLNAAVAADEDRKTREEQRAA